jgi:hypothetical protein
MDAKNPSSNSVQAAPLVDTTPEVEVEHGGIEDLEEEAGQQGAFNPETGEINWDCPCLGGMAHGPCGEEFKAAFSCFVYSNEEPKGMDCIDKFKYVHVQWQQRIWRVTGTNQFFQGHARLFPSLP